MFRSAEERIKASEQMVAAGASLLTLSTIAVIIRFASRRISRSKYWWDDWLSLIGLCAFTTFCGNIYGSTFAYSMYRALLKTFADFPKYWDDQRYPLSEADKVDSAEAEFMAAIQCIPVAASWKPTSTPPKCIKLNVFFWGASVPNILIDLFLIILPMPDLYTLRIPRAQKCFVMGIFLLGGFVLFASAFRFYYIINLDDEDFKKSWMIHKSVRWTVAEHRTGIICICLAPSRPFFAKIPCVASVFTRAENAPEDMPSFSWLRPAPAQEAVKMADTTRTSELTSGMGTTATADSRDIAAVSTADNIERATIYPYMEVGTAAR
ncbi:hypothetical protein EK21DRAFT_111703 [Setomelanomma holmii]|uniref:Rhodopsin domain-containing protein n=1 Tax=Setomelanomma holmii TaxID=210430 RepID=A0A9P4H976_9PLEO|nr:hypothetical protein EK21DRAFT_111703 [Setomelanomma holmii]